MGIKGEVEVRARKKFLLSRFAMPLRALAQVHKGIVTVRPTPNERKQGVSFVEAVTVFEDIDLLVNVDPADPARFVAVGFSSTARVLVVVHVTRAERLRIISARRATIREESAYAERRGR